MGKKLIVFKADHVYLSFDIKIKTQGWPGSELVTHPLKTWFKGNLFLLGEVTKLNCKFLKTEWPLNYASFRLSLSEDLLVKILKLEGV